MQMTPKFKILPILIVVALVAFTVRLVALGLDASQSGERVQFTHMKIMPDKKDGEGVADITPAAGEEEAPAEEAEPEAEAENLEPPPQEGLAFEEPQMDVQNDTDDVQWRDPADDEFEYSTITREVFEDMGNRRRALDAREKELMAREALLTAAEKEINRKFEELTNLKAEIESLLQQQSEEEAARFESLVKIYEAMKPKEAARIFDTLDLDVLLAVMSRMSERRLSPILANMNPERARTITIMLAEEKQLPSLPPMST